MSKLYSSLKEEFDQTAAFKTISVELYSLKKMTSELEVSELMNQLHLFGPIYLGPVVAV